MKLLRYGELGKERPGVLDADGQIRDLSGHIEDISGSVLSTNAIDKLKEINVENQKSEKSREIFQPAERSLLTCGNFNPFSTWRGDV